MAVDMEINTLIDEGLAGCLDPAWLQTIAEQALAALDVAPQTELGIVIVGQEKIQQLNSEYLGTDEPTDVLAFSMLPDLTPGKEAPTDIPPFVAPPDGVLHLGEVIISYPQAAVQAAEHQHSVQREVAILLIHGILHLLGYDHDTPDLEQQMRTREAEVLSHIEEEIK
jgi:probable rRNA maturation factor